MQFDWKESVEYHRSQGAPGDQNALRSFLSELQEAHGGVIPREILPRAAEAMGVRESFLAAIIRRVPSLRLADVHVLEICGGPNCTRRDALAEAAEQYRGRAEIKIVSCMRRCGQGPNIRFDGKLYNDADAQLLARLVREIDK